MSRTGLWACSPSREDGPDRYEVDTCAARPPAPRAGAGGPGKGCESTLAGVLMFWVSEGAGPKGTGPEDTPNARVAE
ncbi:hypothetical protein GCM10010240_24570 [Streptomyces griseoviridis]|nr:hypothetical protein GCM10010240_24570 [Streptomyces griseoviridis]